MAPTKRETLFPSWWFQTNWKILVKLDHFPQIGVKLIKNLKPPPSDECFILQICSLNFPTTFAVGFFEAEDHLSITAGWLVAGSCAPLVLPPKPTNNKRVTRAILSRFLLLIWSLQIPYGREKTVRLILVTRVQGFSANTPYITVSSTESWTFSNLILPARPHCQCSPKSTQTSICKSSSKWTY